ncbi:2-keto-4-pentenoate hydratase [Micromonospora halophytica]|uniref:2-keto-4-pentenoate hydratase n=1 Tax=Micromonospora halophytica TaxID=47864 RepID=A0A1C5J475_9ACTN|nr:fumarylacetoacetate hydrolase family protein [Micromonospora halophytica]SCG65384.1 2-keto-4-pentenoate hydratase [Micromonospora halophytica]
MTVDIEAANRELAEARTSGKPCAPLRGRLLPEGDVESAYRVQQLQARAWQGRGERRVGAKIGLTSRAAQDSFGVHQPDFGLLTHVMAVGDGVEVAIDRLIQPRVEAEVAFVLGRDLTEERVTTVDLIGAVDHVLPAIEIVDSRIAGWDISIVDTVADNASSGMYVLGTRPRRLADVDLRLAGMVLEHAGEPVSVGAGAACMGSPLNALQWLAGTLARAGDPLRAGDVVLSGSLGPVVPVVPGGAYEARISGLGSVRTCFSKGLS